MCGIFAYTGYRNNAAQLVLSGLKSLEYRGYDSWGIAVVPFISSKLNPSASSGLTLSEVEWVKAQRSKIQLKVKNYTNILRTAN